jgi:multiple sugar transport system substrate-binding protein
VKRQVIAAMGLAFSSALLLAGCGTTTSAQAAQSHVPRHAAKAAITWWVPSPSPIPGTLHAAARRFTQASGIPVRVESFPWSNYLTKITTAITSGVGPDVIEIGNTWAPTLADSGGLVPWTAKMFKAIGGESKFLKTSMEVTTAPGKPIVSVPFLGQTWVLEYNKEMFKKAHIASPPRTWRQFITDAKKLSDPAKGIYGVAAPIGANGADQTWDWIIFRQEGGHYYQHGKPSLTLAADVNTLTNFIKWVYPDRIINPANVADSTGTLCTTEFERGQAAMLLTQTPQQAVDDQEKYGIGYVPLPTHIPPGGAAIMSHVAGENLAIFKNSKHLNEDLEFIKFLTSPKEQELINKNMFELPVTKAGLNTPYFQSPAEKTFGEILAKYAAPMPTEASSATLFQDVASATITLLRDDISAHNITPAQVRSALNSVQQTIEAESGG